MALVAVFSILMIGGLSALSATSEAAETEPLEIELVKIIELLDIFPEEIIAVNDGYVICGYEGNAYIEKRDKDFNVVWSDILEGDGSSYNALKQTADGGYIVAGYEKDKEYLIAKYDSEGNQKWITNPTGTPNITLLGLIVVEDGYVTIGCSYADSKSYIIKFDLDGNEEDRYETELNRIWGMTYNSDLFLIFTGSSYKTEIYAYDYNIDLQWNNTYDYNISDINAYKNGFYGAASVDNTTGLLLIFDENADIVKTIEYNWQETYETQLYVSTYKGDYYVTAGEISIDTFWYEYGLVVIFDEDGNVLYEKKISDELENYTDSYAIYITTTPDGFIVVYKAWDDVSNYGTYIAVFGGLATEGGSEETAAPGDSSNPMILILIFLIMLIIVAVLTRRFGAPGFMFGAFLTLIVLGLTYLVW